MTPQDMALMTTRLQLPAVVDDILAGKTPLSEDMTYSLHELISNMPPDMALLAMSVAGQKILAQSASDSPDIRNFERQSQNVIAGLGAEWMNMTENPDEYAHLDTSDILEYIPEDLEALSDFANTAADYFQDVPTRLLNIFKIQARTQAMIADAFLEEFYSGKEKELAVCASSSKPDIDNNVIPFPAF